MENKWLLAIVGVAIISIFFLNLTPTVSIQQLLANPNSYIGKKIKTSGYVFGFETSQILMGLTPSSTINEDYLAADPNLFGSTPAIESFVTVEGWFYKSGISENRFILIPSPPAPI